MDIKSRYTGDILFMVSGNTLQEADLREANLQGANLREANLREANLWEANLWEANLQGANLQGAYLQKANLREANLQGANLREANLREANLWEANLWEANLQGAKLPHFQICPSEGSFIAWKKTTKGVIKIEIPKDAKRTASLVGRKCRASHIKVLSGVGCGGHSPIHGQLVYEMGLVVRADKFDDDIRVECTHGIHFFMTEQEAEEW